MKEPAEQIVKEIRRAGAGRRLFSAAEKFRIVLSGLRGENTIAEPWRREGDCPEPVLSLVEGISQDRQKSRNFGSHRCLSRS